MLLPLRVDVPTVRWPIMNVLLIAVIIPISMAGMLNRDFLYKYSGTTVKADLSDVLPRYSLELTTENFSRPMLAVTSTFLHAGWVHLIGNMWFLWIFGNAVNAKFGQFQYLVLYLLCGMAGGLAHYAFTGRPAIGASGAIYGVMGAFLIYYPRNDINMLLFLLLFLRRFTISSIWILAFWVAWDAATLGMEAGKGVALWAHLTGFGTGLAIAIACLATGLIKTTQDEQSLLQLLGIVKVASPTYPRRG